MAVPPLSPPGRVVARIVAAEVLAMVMTRRAFGRALLGGAAVAGLTGAAPVLAAEAPLAGLDRPRTGHSVARAPDGRLFVVGGVSVGSPVPVGTDVVLRGGAWGTLARRPGAHGLWYAGTAVMAGRLWVVGGAGPASATDEIWSYDVR